MKFIEVTNSKRLSVVSDEDIERVILLDTKWRACFDKHGKATAIVSTRCLFGNNHIILHRFILKCVKSNGLFVDHIDRDIFNNQRNNLRLVSNRLNQLNRGLMITNNSGCSGVYMDRKTGKWRIMLRIKGKKTCFGSYDNLEAAVTERKRIEQNKTQYV